MNVSAKETGKSSTIIKVEIEKMLGYEAEDFQKLVLDAFDKGNKLVVVDLTKVKFISSWGIGALMYGLTTAKNRNAKFRIAGASENIRDTFSKIKIDTILEIYNTVDEAINN
ncbi:MAG: anti-sigma factor antagonist [Ignavibacteriales bacterium]|nr:MAG: anti-sigma factor antagonist [Ignavibacteriales bacterium]